MEDRGAKYARDVCAAFRDLRVEFAREDRPPMPLVLPNPEWMHVTYGPFDVIFRRPETQRAVAALDKRIASNQDWQKRWSAWEIRRVVGDALGTAAVQNLSDKDTFEQLMRAIVRLDAPPEEWLHYYIVSGAFFVDEIAFGPFRAFRLINAEYNAMVATYRDTLYSTAHTTAEKAEMLEHRLAELQALHGMACVEVRVNGGDMRFRSQLAEQRLEEALDFFQVLHEDSGGWPPGTRIIAHALPFSVAPTPMIRADRAATSWHISFAHMHRAEITAEMVEKARGGDFGALIAALERAPEMRTDFERALLNAMHWIADARRQPAPELQLTDAVTAFEIFFTADTERTPITRDVSEGVALIVGKTLAQRQWIKKRVGTLYGRRSGVTHAGKREVTDAELYEIRNLAVNFLRRMSKLAPLFDTRVDVRTWLEKLRLSFSYDDPSPAEKPSPETPV